MIAILVIALMWRHYAAHRPAFALEQIAVAIRDHDGTKLAYYADAAGVSEHIVDETVDWLVARDGLDAVRSELNADDPDAVASARVNGIKAVLSERLGRALDQDLMSGPRLRDSVGQRVLDAFLSHLPLAIMVPGDHLDIRTVGPIDVQDATALVPVVLRYRELTVDARPVLVLRRDGPRWRLVDVRGLREAFETFDNAQREHIIIANRPREEELKQWVSLGPPSVRRVARGRARTFYRLEVPVSNRGPSPLLGLTLAVSGRASDDSHATELAVEHEIAPGGRSSEIWQFDETGAASSRFAALLARPDRLVLNVRALVIDSAGQADTLRLLRTYRELKEDRGQGSGVGGP